MPRRRAEDCLDLERHKLPSFNAPTRSAHSGKHSTGNSRQRRTEQRARRAMHDARRALTFVSQVRAARSLHPALPAPAVGRGRAARAPGRARRRAWARTPGGGRARSPCDAHYRTTPPPDAARAPCATVQWTLRAFSPRPRLACDGRRQDAFSPLQKPSPTSPRSREG